MFKSLYLDESNFKDYNTISNDRVLRNLSKINLFIGTNNSGKSRFTRTFFFKDDIQFELDGFDIQPINKIIANLKKEIDVNFKLYVNGDYGGIKSNILPTFHNSEFISQDFDFERSIIVPLNSLKSMQANHATSGQWNGGTISKVVQDIAQKASAELDKVMQDKSVTPKQNNIYIPTLRGLRNVSNGHDDVFFNRTKKDYFNNNAEIAPKVYTGLTLYEDTKRLLLGPKHNRDLVKNFELFLSVTFFNKQEVNIIPHIDSDVVHIRIGDEEHPIFNLGDGIQSIIILTYPLFFNQDKHLNVFIEEPEHCLHPGLQRTFVETLLRPEFNKFQFFITTHSNHLLDVTLDIDKISIYTFKKTFRDNNEPYFIIENIENEDSNVLSLIGVRNSSVLLANCTIWVEGITDRIYLRKYLDIFQNKKDFKFKEDTHYTFVEYGGNNITHWSFLKPEDPLHPNIQVDRLCGKSFLIVDNDGALTNPNSKKALRLKELEETLKDRFYALKCREIENTLNLTTIRSVIEEYEGPNSASLSFKNSFNESNLSNQYIGKFIDSSVSGLSKSFSATSGTIKDKLNFSKIAVAKIDSIDHLSEEAKILTEKLYNFIKDNN